MERGSSLDEGNSCDINVYSKTPRLVCSLILCSPPIPSLKTVSCYDNIEYEFAPSSFETGFMRQKLQKGNRSFGSMSLANSRQSVQSIGTHMTNHTASTGDTATSPSLKRSGSFSSTGSLTSLQIHQSNNSSSTSRPTAAFALPSNPLGSTPIKIAFQEYLLVPTSDSRVLVYQIVDFLQAEIFGQEAELNRHAINRNESFYKHLANNRRMASKLQQEKQSVLPILAIGPFHLGDHSKSLRAIEDKSQAIPASIVDICVCEVDSNLQNTGLLGNIAILTQDGGVHIYESYMLQKRNGAHEDGELPLLQINHMQSFNSGKISATAITMSQSEIWEAVMVNNTTLRNQKSELSIAVGFDDGDIVEFTAVERQQKVKWRGSMGFPIQSLAYIHNENATKSTSRPGKNDTTRPRDKLHLIIGTTENLIKKHVKYTSDEIVASCLDIISVVDAEKEWASKFRGVSRRSVSSTIEVSEISIWPAKNITGKEGFRITLPEQTSKQQLAGVKAVCSINISDSGQSFSTLLGNGALVTFHYQMYATGLSWGLQHNRNHIMMPFPSFAGAGIFDTESSSSSSQFIACCLRGGTVIVIPVKHSQNFSCNDVLLNNTSFDSAGIDDDSVRFIQGFTAGNIRVRSLGQSLPDPKRLLKIYFQAWSCGTIECYTCDPQYRGLQGPDDMTSQVYRELKSNGALERLISLLTSDHSHLEAGPLLQQASREYRRAMDSNEDFMGLISSGDSDTSSSRQLLAQLLMGTRL